MFGGSNTDPHHVFGCLGNTIFSTKAPGPRFSGFNQRPGESQDRTLVLVEWQLSVPWLHEKLVKSGLKVGI